jgi:ectoine hydroxylase-related dioxygenase (phytanoyl-CoA dioxygenase family)
MSMLLPHAEAIDLEPVLSHFREHGYARVGSVVSPDYLARLRKRADELMLGERVIPNLFFQHDSETSRYEDLEYGRGWIGPSLNYRKLERLEQDDLFRALLENLLFERIARALIGDAVSIYRATLFNKAPNSSPLPWHQDAGSYWGLDRDPNLQIWTALDRCSTEAGCLRVLPGSHLRGLASPLGGLVQPSVLEAERADERARTIPAEAGEVLLIHNYLWHCSGRNEGVAPRRAFTVCYIDADTRCVRKKRAPRQFVRVFG